MTTLALVGAQWGDEGKGKVVDCLAKEADLVARYSGGNNAGHTLVVEGRKIVTHLVPSGVTYPGTLCVLGSGMVVDPAVFQEEVAEIQTHGLLQGDELRVSLDAHVIFGFHRQLDGLREDARQGKAKIGTTRRGIGPAYEAKAARRGIRVRDLVNPEVLRARLETNAASLGPEMTRLGGAGIDVDAALADGQRWGEWLAPMMTDAGELVHEAIKAGKRVLFEGAQGALLDVDHGTYPYVTSTSTCAGGIASGLGIGPNRVNEVWGITKAYATRVGAGPFPSRLDGEDGEAIRQAGGEFGATTGRPRDCGWLDLPALRHAARLNGFTGICVTKLDVLAQLPKVRVCVRYRDGVLPGRDGLENAVPEYEDIPGWGDPELAGRLAEARTLEDLPPVVRAYLDRICEIVEAPLALVSIGADRSQTIHVRGPFETA